MEVIFMAVGCAIYSAVALSAEDKMKKFGFAFGAFVFGAGAILLAFRYAHPPN